MGKENFSLGIAKIDYLEFSSNYLTPNIFGDLLGANISDKGDRFYRYYYDTASYCTRLGRKNKNLKETMTRIKHEQLPYVLEDGLPQICTITRLDICIDYATKEEAFLHVGAREYSCYIDSMAQEGGGQTYYFGDRKTQIFERIYFKPEAGGWRYEVEIKPQSKTLPIGQFCALDDRVKNMYASVLNSMVWSEKQCYAPNTLLASTLPPDKQNKIRVVFELPYLNSRGRKDYWLDLSEVEREYLYTLYKINKGTECGDWWAFLDRLRGHFCA